MKKRSRQQHQSPDGLDLPDDDFNYEDYIAREFGRVPHRALGIKWYWWMLGFAVLASMVAGVFWNR